MRVRDILENPFLWRTFRKTLDFFFGLYRKRMVAIRSLDITDEMSVVDVACGTGEYSSITKGDYLGVDMNEKYIKVAQKIYGTKNKKFLAADANTAQIANSSFDVAILIDATHHFSDQENLTLFSTLGRVASKAVLICDPIIQPRSNLIGRFLIYLDRGNYVRKKQQLLDLINQKLRVEKVVNMKMVGVNSVCILARPN